MDMGHSIFLGIVQGLTEFLPVSSSGHLVLFQNLLGVHGAELLFDTALHFGTLLALCMVFRKDIAGLLRSFLRLCSPAQLRALPGRYRSDETTRLLILIIIGSVPTVLIGLAFKDLFERLFSSLQVVGCTLMITGALLWLTRRCANTSRDILQMTAFQALAIGFVQGLAITPGISRSGSTIAVALLLGIGRETSGRFSFLLSMPAILGATLLGFGSTAVTSAELYTIAAGTGAAVITGYLSLVLLLKVIRKGRFYLFAPYCLLAGLAALACSLYI